MAKKKKKKTVATTKSKMKRKQSKKTLVNYNCYAPFQLQPGCPHNIRPCGRPTGGGGGSTPPTMSGGF